MILKLGCAAALTGLDFSAATAAENIECMDQALSVEDTQELGQFALGSAQAQSNLTDRNRELMQTVAGRARSCAEKNSWSSDATQQAIIYAISVAAAAALERNSPLNPSQMDNLRRHYRDVDREKLDSIADRLLDAGITGQARRHNDADKQYLAATIMKIGIPATMENARYVGQWIGGQRMLERSKGQFRSSL